MEKFLLPFCTFREKMNIQKKLLGEFFRETKSGSTEVKPLALRRKKTRLCNCARYSTFPAFGWKIEHSEEKKIETITKHFFGPMK